MALLKDTTDCADVKTDLDEVYNDLLSGDAVDSKECSEWFKMKTKMRQNPQINNSFPIFKKGVYFINFGKNIGSEQEKDRPAVIIWTQQKSPFVIAAPISDEHKGSTFWFHVHLSSGDTVLVEQIRVVSKARIRTPIREKGRIRELLKSELDNINNVLDKLKFT